MIEVNFYEPSEIKDHLLAFAVIIARTEGRWVFCKHRERDTYEVPGGHRETRETILETARRELREETGAIDFSITPVNLTDEDESFGMLFAADIFSFEKELHSEIEKIILSDGPVSNWTYPAIQPKLLAEAVRRGYLR